MFEGKTLDILRHVQLPFKYLLDFYAIPCICILYTKRRPRSNTLRALRVNEPHHKLPVERLMASKVSRRCDRCTCKWL